MNVFRGRIVVKKTDTLECFIVLFSPEKLTLLALFEDVKLSPDQKMIKLSTSYNLFPPSTFSIKLVVQ